MRKEVKYIIIIEAIDVLLVLLFCFLGWLFPCLIALFSSIVLMFFAEYLDRQLKQVDAYINLRIHILAGKPYHLSLEELDSSLTRFQKFLYEKCYKR